MKTLVVVARRYNGHELWTALGVMQEAGHEFEVISTSTRIQDEVTGQQNIIERTIDEVEPQELGDFDGLMFVSGNMKDTELYWNHPRTLRYVEIAKQLNMPIAAICCSVPTIRGAADGKRVSFFPLIRSADLLKRAGAILETVSITVDGNLVTAEHQMSSQVWAEMFSQVLNGEEADPGLIDSGFKPQGKTYRRLPDIIERSVYTDVEYERLKQLDRDKNATDQ